MRIRHLSYISTDLFWTKISTANPKVAFLPLCAHLFCMGKAVLHTKPYIFCHTKNPRKRHPKIFGAQFSVRISHQLAEKSTNCPFDREDGA